MNCSEVNTWLDRLMDDELSDEMRRELEAHAEICPDCAENIKATIEMKELLSGMDEEADVPLAAQAAWRKAVRQEASRMKYRRFYRAAGAVAAAVVLVVGLHVGLNNSIGNVSPDTSYTTVMTVDAADESGFNAAGIAVIESDGTEVTAKARMMPEPAQKKALTECVICVEDVSEACGYIKDLVAEYEGSIDEQGIEGKKANLYITLPSENIESFKSAAQHLDSSGSAFDVIMPSAGETTSLVMILNG